MYQLSGKITAKEGFEIELFQLLQDAGMEMEKLPNCEKYQVTQNPENPREISIEEEWTDQASHQSSLTLPITQHMISKGKPMIESME